MRRPLVPALRLLGLFALGLVLAHQSVYLVRYGSIYGEALVHAGHGQGWSDAVTTVLVSAVLLITLAIARLVRLGAHVAALELATGRSKVGATRRAPASGPPLRQLARRWLRMFAILAPAIVIALTIQENAEHVAAGFSAPGVGILVNAEYPMALPIVAAVAAAVSLVAALLEWTRAVLVARLRAARAQAPRRAPLALRPAGVRIANAPVGSLLARRLGRRAPPLALTV
jgi:hypothetical protein